MLSKSSFYHNLKDEIYCLLYRLSTRSTDHSDTPVSQFHEPLTPSGPIDTEVTTAKPSNFSVPKRSRSPSSLTSGKSSQGDFNVAEDDTER